MRCTLPIGFVLFLMVFLSSCLTAQEAPLRGVVTDANRTPILLTRRRTSAVCIARTSGSRLERRPSR
jgi:hypothetical protein